MTSHRQVLSISPHAPQNFPVTMAFSSAGRKDSQALSISPHAPRNFPVTMAFSSAGRKDSQAFVSFGKHQDINFSRSTLDRHSLRFLSATKAGRTTSEPEIFLKYTAKTVIFVNQRRQRLGLLLRTVAPGGIRLVLITKGEITDFYRASFCAQKSSI
ncbi:hypothetical protein HGRIS_000918 [Hohenbuehelia grisea]|uniref:Uncharacterized protein n=1 Tax=Hohenbuehelia grisea TaxID=104357 RepID=A0ABR3IQ38_9AGAR